MSIYSRVTDSRRKRTACWKLFCAGRRGIPRRLKSCWISLWARATIAARRSWPRSSNNFIASAGTSAAQSASTNCAVGSNERQESAMPSSSRRPRQQACPRSKPSPSRPLGSRKLRPRAQPRKNKKPRRRASPRKLQQHRDPPFTSLTFPKNGLRCSRSQLLRRKRRRRAKRLRRRSLPLESQERRRPRRRRHTLNSRFPSNLRPQRRPRSLSHRLPTPEIHSPRFPQRSPAWLNRLRPSAPGKIARRLAPGIRLPLRNLNRNLNWIKHTSWCSIRSPPCLRMRSTAPFPRLRRPRRNSLPNLRLPPISFLPNWPVKLISSELASFRRSFPNPNLPKNLRRPQLPRRKELRRL